MRKSRDKSASEERYLQREKKSIERSRKMILMEKERLQTDYLDLPEHLYRQVQQDLMALSKELKERESAFEARKGEEQYPHPNPSSCKRGVVDEETPPSFWENTRSRVRKAVMESSYDRVEKVFLSLIVCIQMAALASIVNLILRS